MENLKNDIIYNYEDLQNISRYLDYNNRRGSNIIPLKKGEYMFTYVNGLKNKYLVVSKLIERNISEFNDYNSNIAIGAGDTIDKFKRYTNKLQSILSENGVKSVKDEIERGKKLGQETKIVCVLDEQCGTFLTRRTTSSGNVDIPFTIHALYGEWKYGDKNNIKNLPVIEKYLEYIEQNVFKTSYIGNFVFLHLAPSKHSKANVNFHDAEFIVPYLISDKKKLFGPIDDEYIKIFVENQTLYTQVCEKGYELYAADLILNNMKIKDKFDVDTCLEIRHGSPINKPKRLYMLNLRRLICC